MLVRSLGLLPSLITFGKKLVVSTAVLKDSADLKGCGFQKNGALLTRAAIEH
jgi:hypothetical protein